MKKIMALVLVAVMMMAISMTAFADITPQRDRTKETDGSIEVTGTIAGQTYTLYRIFKADMYSADSTAITYNTDGAALADNAYFELNDNGFVVAKSGLADDWAKDAAARTWALANGTAVGTAITTTADGDEVKWTGLEYGYYYVTSSLGAFISVDSANKEGVINEKNSKPSVDKSITGVKDSEDKDSGSIFDATETSETTDPGNGVDEQAIAQKGDTVSYKLVITIKPGAKNYVISDSMTNLKLVASSFKVGNAAIAGNAKVDAAGTTITDKASTFTIKLAQSYLDTITEETTLEITYDAKLDASAAVANEANPNTVTLTWGDNPQANKSEDSAKVWTAKVNVLKRAESSSGEALKGAGFKLKKGDLFYKMTTDGVTWVAEADANEFFTGDDGKLTTEFTGLANGSYTLVESTVPAGYNKLDDTPVTIADSDVTLDNLAQTINVINNAGSVLPSTGGIGTTIFYVIGAILVLGAGILLVTRRRMSAN